MGRRKDYLTDAMDRAEKGVLAALRELDDAFKDEAAWVDAALETLDAIREGLQMRYEELCAEMDDDDDDF